MKAKYNNSWILIVITGFLLLLAVMVKRSSLEEGSWVLLYNITVIICPALLCGTLYHHVSPVFLPLMRYIKCKWVLFFLIAGFITVFGTMVTFKYYAMTYEMLDLGNMDMAIYNAWNGNGMVSTRVIDGINASRFSGHFELIYWLLTPLMSFAATALPLLWVQVLVLAMGTIPLFYIAKHYGNNNNAALLLSLAYIVYPAMNFSALFSFHGDTLAIPLIMCTILTALKRKYILMYLCFFAAWCCKEYISLLAPGMGIWLYLSAKEKKHGIVVGVGGILYFATVFFGIIPAFNDGAVSARFSENYSQLGSEGGLRGIVTVLLSSPGIFFTALFRLKNIENFIWLLLPLGFLPIKKWLFLFSALPLIAKDLLFELDIYNHHSDAWLPYLFWAAAAALGQVQDQTVPSCKYNRNAYLLICIVLSAALIGPSPLGRRFWHSLHKYTVTSHDRTIRESIRLLPGDARISCSGHLAPWLTHREYCAIFPKPEGLIGVEYIAVDTLEQKEYNWSLKSDTRQALKTLGPQWIKEFEKNGVLIFHRKSE